MDYFEKNQFALNNLAAAQCSGGVLGAPIRMPTIGENIADQIERHEQAIARLQATRANLDKANLLDLKISDLREAMNY